MKKWWHKIWMLFSLGTFLMGMVGFTYHELTCISCQQTDIHVVPFAGGVHNHDCHCCAHGDHKNEKELPAAGSSITCCTDSYSHLEVDDTYLDTGKNLISKPLAHKLLRPFQLSLTNQLNAKALSYSHSDSGPPLVPDNYIYHLSSLLL